MIPLHQMRHNALSPSLEATVGGVEALRVTWWSEGAVGQEVGIGVLGDSDAVE